MKLHNLAEALTFPRGELLDMWSLQTGSCTPEELQLGVDGAMGQTKKMLLYRDTDAALQGCFQQFCMEPKTVHMPWAY